MRPVLSIKDKDIPLIFKTVIQILSVHILQRIYQVVMKDPLGVPKPLGNWNVLRIHMLYVKLFFIFVVCLNQ